MRLALCNREPRVALRAGALVAFLAGLVFALSVILDEGGGSLTRGWEPGCGYLEFYGIFMIPILTLAGLVAVGLSRLIGGGTVMLVATIGLGSVLIHSALSSTPAAQLARATGLSKLPDVPFEHFEKRHTFGDGTSYRWIARCSVDEAMALANALGLDAIPASRERAGAVSAKSKHPAVEDWRQVFDVDFDGLSFYVGDRGMIGGYSPREQRFRLYWWPTS